MPSVRVSQLEDCAALAPYMRQADVDECKANGHSPFQALFASVYESRYCYTGINDDGSILCMFGVVEKEPDVGVVWLLGSDLLPRVPLSFMREAKRFIRLFQNAYPVLTNLVDTRNTVHMEWLRRFGFVFIRYIEHWGPEGRSFVEFVRINKHV